MSDWCDPWHTLTIVVEHFHGPACPGHSQPNMWGVQTEPDIVEKDLVHPDTCKDLRTFCADDNPNRCPECKAGHSDGCLGATGFNYRCTTEQDVMDYYSEIDGPMESGTWRVRSSGSGPDYEGDYDANTEFEPVTDEQKESDVKH